MCVAFHLRGMVRLGGIGAAHLFSLSKLFNDLDMMFLKG